MKTEPRQLPRLIEGGLSIDDRGRVAFVNGFHFVDVKRFYAIANHQAGFVRAWHAHRREGKYVYVAQGAAIVACVAIDNWEAPATDAQVHRFVMSADKPAVLFEPPGYANGFKSLTADTVVLFFSTASFDETKGDDVRYDAHYWDPWQVEER